MRANSSPARITSTLLGVLILAASCGRGALTRTEPNAVASSSEPAEEAPAAAEEEVEEDVGEDVAAPARTPRERAAWSMLSQLELTARTLLRAGPQFTNGTCPKSVANVTFGTAKTDPWGNRFAMECADTGPRFRSAGADGELNTADDVRGWEPFVTNEAARASACAAARRCGSARVEPCDDAPELATLQDDRALFALDTCGALEDCALVERCLDEVLERCVGGSRCRVDAGASRSEFRAIATCEEFARVAARRASAPPSERPALRRACDDYGFASFAELVCIEHARTPQGAARCVLTVNRGWVAAWRERAGDTGADAG